MARGYTKQVRRKVASVGSRGREWIVTRSPLWLKRALRPVALHADLYLTDHGIFRSLYLNHHRLDEHAFRSAQPSPRQIRKMSQLGVKTIINLRGARSCGSYTLERAACERHGVELIDFRMRSRAGPSPDDLRRVAELFQQIQYPVLFHCKSGADRAGIMSVLYLFLHRGVPIETALNQLSLKYGHIRQAETGVLDHFFESFIAARDATGVDFWTWLERDYDPNRLKAEFQSNKFADRVVNSVLRRE